MISIICAYVSAADAQAKYNPPGNGTEMTKTSTKPENRPSIPKEDAALYRLFAIIAFAVAGFAWLIAIGKHEGKYFDLFASVWFKAGMLVLFAASAAVIVLSLLGRIKNNGSIFSLAGICAVAAPVFLIFASYTEMTNANIKSKILFIAVIFIAFIANVYPKNHARFSAAVMVCAASMYYLGHYWAKFSGRLFDQLAKAASYPAAFIIPAALLVILFIAKKNGGTFKVKGKKLFSINDKTVFWGMVTISAAAIVFSAIILILPISFLPLMIAFGAIYIVLGIICTIKIL